MGFRDRRFPDLSLRQQCPSAGVHGSGSETRAHDHDPRGLGRRASVRSARGAGTRLRLLARLLVLLGSLSLAAPSAQSASFGDEDEDEEHSTAIPDQIFGLPGSSCSKAYVAALSVTLPEVETSMGTVTYKLEGVPATLTYDAGERELSGILTTDLRTASAVSHTLKYTATDDAGSDSLTFEIAIVDERPALEDFYTETGGANWTTKTNWAADIPAANCLADLYGVTLLNGAVSELNLSGNNLTGEIPHELEDLRILSTLDLSDNKLTGEIPEDVGHFHELRTLDLSNNSLTGEIPEELGHLPYLYTLDLSDNKLTGEIPEDVGHLHLLRNLDLSNNSLTGEIPEDFDSGTGFTHPGHLEKIDFSNNSLTGSIPKLAKFTPNLRILDLSHNQLSGVLPGDLSKLSYLTDLDLSHNQLSGSIPAAYSSSLLTLDLSHNQFSGAIPATFHRSFTNVFFIYDIVLTRVDLSHNELTGTIPAGLSNISSLETLDLSHNELTGMIPDPGFRFGELLTLDLSHNQLSGKIFPIDQVNQKLVKIVRLDFSHNQLSGEISALDLSFNAELLTLDLSHNQLSGKIPSKLPPNLETLYLHNNSLSGEIPAGLGTATKLRSLSLYHNPPPGSTSSTSLFKYPSGMNRQSNLHLLVPNTGSTTCLYQDALGAEGTTECTIPTTIDRLQVFTVDQVRAWDCTTWIAVRWSAPSDPAPSGYQLQYRPSAPAAGWTPVTVGTEPFAAISGLTHGQSYEVRVRTTDTPDASKPALRTPWLQASVTLSSE